MVEQSAEIRYTKIIMTEYTEGYIRALSQFQGSRYDNSFIVRIHYGRIRKAGPDCRFQYVCLWDRTRSQLLQAEAWAGNCRVGTLQVELLFTGPKVNYIEKAGLLNREPGPPEGYRPWRAFTSEEVRGFSRRTGDTNPIHLDSRPVVQGLLLWQSLFVWLGEPETIHMLFKSPVHGGEMIYCREEKINERNEREFASVCGRNRQPGTDPVHDRQRCLCRAAGGVGVHFFSAAFYPGHGDGADHYGEPGGLHHEAETGGNHPGDLPVAGSSGSAGVRRGDLRAGQADWAHRGLQPGFPGGSCGHERRPGEQPVL